MAARKKFENIENVTKGFISTPTPEEEPAGQVEHPEPEQPEKMTILEKLKQLQDDLPEGYVIRRAPKRARLTLLVPEDMKAKLQQIAKDEATSMNELLYGAIDDLIKRKENKGE